MKLSDAQLLPGDICLTTDNSWVGNSIKWWETMWTGKATMTHAFEYVGDGNVIEAMGSIRENPITNYDSRGVVVYRVPLSDDERKSFIAGAVSLLGGPYGYWKYPLFILDAGTSWVKRRLGMNNPSFFFSDTFGFPKDPVCSQLVVECLYRFTSYRIKDSDGSIIEWKSFSPDYLDDELKLPCNNATVVFNSIPVCP
jgi:hypothetical protein